MEKYLIFVIIVNFLFNGTLAEKKPTGPLDPICMNYAIPEPPCCGSNFLKLAYRLAGGEIINKAAGEFPWWATVRDPVISCVASLVNTEWVATAGHCASRHQVKIEIDGWVEGGVQVDKVLKIADLALMHMVQPVAYEFRIRPICLPIAPELKHHNFTYSKVMITGYDHYFRSRKDVIASQDNNKMKVFPRYTKPGDSGAPMVMQLKNNPRKIKAHYLIGVHSASTIIGSIAFSVPFYIDWFKEILTTDPTKKLQKRVAYVKWKM